MTYVARNTGITTDWVSYTPTIAWTNTTQAGRWRRVGDSVQVTIDLAFSGAPGGISGFILSSELLPSGLAVDIAKLPNTTDARIAVGTWGGIDSASSGAYGGHVSFAGTTGIELVYPTGVNGATSVTSTQPVTWGANDNISFTVTLPIVGWTTNVLQADRALEEYASNFDSSNAASNTTSFAYGPDGSQMPIGAIGTTYNRTCQFLTPIQPTDTLVLEFSLDQNSTWVTPASRGLGYTQQGSVGYGASMIATGASTVLVSFQGGGYTPNNATYATNGSAPWSAVGWKWRVRKVSGGASVGFPLSGKNIIPEETIQPPLVSSTSLAFGVGVRLVNSGSPTTQTLPTITAADDGKRIVVKNIGAGTVTVATSGGALIDGQSTQALNQYECANLMAYNSNWFIV